MSWTEKQEREFALLLLAMGELYEMAVSPARAEMFCRCVEDLPYEAVRGALAQHGRSSRFFPKPADVRELVDGNVEDKADLAWAFVLREISRVGYMGTPNWPDEATKRAALSLYGSWRALCQNLPSGAEGHRPGAARLSQAVRRGVWRDCATRGDGRVATEPGRGAGGTSESHDRADETWPSDPFLEPEVAG